MSGRTLKGLKPEIQNDALYKIPNRQRILLIVLVALGWGSDNFDRKILPVALPFIGKDFHVDHTQLGLLSSIFFIFYAISQVPGGALADRFGSKGLMVGAMFVWSAFTGLMGAGSLFWMLIACQALFGIGQGAWPGSSMKFVSEVTPSKYRMTTYGAIQFTTALGSALAPLAAAIAISGLGWRGMFAAFMLLGVILGVFMWWLVPKLKNSGANVVDQNISGSGESFAPRARVGQSIRLVLGSPTLWKCAAMFVGLDIIMNGVTAWVPSYLIDVRHVDLLKTGFLASTPGYCSAVAMFVGGILFDRWFHGRQRLLLIPCMLLSIACVLLMSRSSSTTWFILFYCAAMFISFLTFQTIAGIPMRYCAPEIRGAATAFVNVGGAIGGFVAPLAAGYLIDHYSYDVAFFGLGCAGLITVAASIACPQRPDILENRLAGIGSIRNA